MADEPITAVCQAVASKVVDLTITRPSGAVALDACRAVLKYDEDNGSFRRTGSRAAYLYDRMVELARLALDGPRPDDEGES